MSNDPNKPVSEPGAEPPAPDPAPAPVPVALAGDKFPMDPKPMSRLTVIGITLSGLAVIAFLIFQLLPSSFVVKEGQIGVLRTTEGALVYDKPGRYTHRHGTPAVYDYATRPFYVNVQASSKDGIAWTVDVKFKWRPNLIFADKFYQDYPTWQTYESYMRELITKTAKAGVAIYMSKDMARGRSKIADVVKKAAEYPMVFMMDFEIEMKPKAQRAEAEPQILIVPPGATVRITEAEDVQAEARKFFKKQYDQKPKRVQSKAIKSKVRYGNHNARRNVSRYQPRRKCDPWVSFCTSNGAPTWW